MVCVDSAALQGAQLLRGVGVVAIMHRTRAHPGETLVQGPPPPASDGGDAEPSDVDTAFHVLVVGGGFAGLTLARRLAASAAPAALRVTLVEPKHFAEYTPGVLRAFALAGVAPHLHRHPPRAA